MAYIEVIQGLYMDVHSVLLSETNEAHIKFRALDDAISFGCWLKKFDIAYRSFGRIVAVKHPVVEHLKNFADAAPLPYLNLLSQEQEEGPQTTIKYGEDSKEYQNLYAKYSHIGCPGVQYEDNCAAPWECASEGGCRISKEKRSS